MILRIVFLVALALSFLTGSAQAQEYTKASWPNLVRTMVRFNALDVLHEQILVDEYAIVTECDLYNTFYTNDFKWNQVREAIRQSVQKNVASFPTNYYYDMKMQLDRYDFTNKLFRFTEKSMLRNVNTFVFYSVEGTGCGNADVKFIPRTYRAVFSTPLFMEGLPLSADDAKALLGRMEAEKNLDRIIYARYNMRTTYIEPFRKTIMRGSANDVPQFTQSTAPAANTARIDVRLDSVVFYEDPQMTKQIFVFQP